MFRVFLKDSFVYFIVKGIVSVLWIAIVFVFTKLLSPLEYSNYSIVLIFCQLLSVSVNSWITAGLLRYYSAYGHARQEFSHTIKLLSIIGIL